MKKEMTRKRKIIIFGSIAFLIILVSSIFTINYVISNTVDNFNFEITAKNYENNEILTDTEFIIKSEKNYSKNIINKIVSISPQTSYKLSKIQKGTYLLTPDSKLKDNTLYNINIDVEEGSPSLSWAFETKTDFLVTTSLPYASSTYVDLDTGIEIYFSKPVSDITSYFEIYPKTTGRFEYVDKKVIFIPDSLEKDTPYKVTVKSGLLNVYGEKLEEDYTFSFRTTSYDPQNYTYFYLQDGYQQTFSSNSTPKIAMSLSDDYEDANFFVNVYKLSSVDEYTSYLETHYKNIDEFVGKDYDHVFDMSKHPCVLSFETKANENLTRVWAKDILFPEKLPVGWYILDVTTSVNNLHFQKAIQVSDIATYTYGLNGDVRIWCNDTDTNEVVSGATVQVGDLAAITNKDGVATFNINDDGRKTVIITSKDGREFGEYISLTNLEKDTIVDNYYTYIYTDRVTYLPTDTIKYWGVILPRKSNLTIPKEINVGFGDVLGENVKVNEDGIFSGEISLANYQTGYFGVSINIGEDSQYLTSIEVTDYTKPVYKLSSAFDKKYYRANDKINLNVYGKFYDGTSAENVKVKVSYGNDEYKTVTLNDNGEATTTISPSVYDESGNMTYVNISLEMAGVDEYATNYNYAMYFPTDYKINSTWMAKDNKLKLSTNKIDYTAISDNNVDYDKLYLGESFNQHVGIRVKSEEYVKKYVGSSYNYYTGVNEPDYTYERVENILETKEIDIIEGQEYILDIPYLDKNSDLTYIVELTYTYPDGFYGKEEVYLYDNYRHSDKAFYFSVDKPHLKENESTEIQLNGENKENGRMMYIVSTDKVYKAGVTNKDNLEVKMSYDLIPNCLVSGAFFDGNNIYEISEAYIDFDSSDRKLNISIDTDKESYKPGEIVNAVLKVTDKDNNPLKTNLVVSVVDEAALFDRNDENVLGEIYKEIYHLPKTFVSYVYEGDFGGEGGGGGDEEGIRNAFVDTLLFASLTTSSDGEAKISFKTSDDLTSWRVTATAVNNNVSAGSTSKNITTSIPFFINPVISSKYTKGDDISISLRTVGTVSPLLSSNVIYEVKLLNINGEEINSQTISSKPKELVMVNLGKLDIGTYKVQISSSSGDYKDAIEKEIKVVDSFHELSIVSEVDLENMANLNIERFPVNIMLFDKTNGLYYKSLKKILEESNGRTKEQVLSRNIAYSKLNEFYGEDIYEVDNNIVLQDYDGAVRNISYAKDNTLLTAQITANAREYINKETAKDYFYRVISEFSSTPDDVTAAYMGLASLKQPVLTDIKYLLENDNGLELLDKINLINALTYIGDYSSAKYYYEKEIKGLMENTNSGKCINKEYETYYYQATSRILPTLLLTRHDDFESVLNYVLENSTREYIPNMDLLAFITKYNPKSSKEKLTYFLKGEKNKIDFSKDKIKIVKLDKASFDTFKIDSKTANVDAIISYVGGVSDINLIDGNIKINKTISNGELGEYSTVTLNIISSEASPDYYIINDVIPACSRYVTQNYLYNNSWGFLGYEKQKVQFYINTKESKNITIKYNIRNVLSGDFAIEPAYITTEEGKVLNSVADLLLNLNVK